jgi:hypothetical protein
VAVLVCGQVEKGEVVFNALKPLSLEFGLVKWTVFLPGPGHDERQCFVVVCDAGIELSCGTAIFKTFEDEDAGVTAGVEC